MRSENDVKAEFFNGGIGGKFMEVTEGYVGCDCRGVSKCSGVFQGSAQSEMPALSQGLG